MSREHPNHLPPRDGDDVIFTPVTGDFKVEGILFYDPETPQEFGWWTRLRIWWWQWRFAERVLTRGFGDRSHESIESARHVAAAGWANQLTLEDGDVALALAESPVEAADEEMCYWTNDG